MIYDESLASICERTIQTQHIYTNNIEVFFKETAHGSITHI